MTQPTLTFRASPVLLARIDRLAAARGVSRSAAIRGAIVQATTPAGASPVPDEREVLALLSEAARGGNVSAMRELLAVHRERRQPQPDTSLGVIDELAHRRADKPRAPA